MIAEAGVNHNGDLDTAMKLIDAAASAGADAVKFQTFDAATLDPPGERREMLERMQLTWVSHLALKQHADDLGIEFISTPFDEWALNFLVNDLGLKTLKIASGASLKNKPLLQAARQTDCKLIISTGATTLSEVLDLWGILGRGTFLHCVSAYPPPIEEMNLRAIVTMRDALVPLGGGVGLSDHSEGFEAALAAVPLGATVIEKHLTLDRNMEGPDHEASLEEDEFNDMVAGIRMIEQMLGDGIKRPQPCEAQAVKIAAEREAWRRRRAA